MIQNIQEPTMLQNVIDQAANTFESPEWFKEYRLSSLNRYQEIGLPTVKEEDWKYTSLKPLNTLSYEKIDSTTLSNTDKLNTVLDQKDINIVYVNGYLSEKHSSFTKLPEGVTILKLSQALTSHSDVIQGIFSRYEASTQTSLQALNTAVFSDGTFIDVKDTTQVKPLIHIIHIADSNSTHAFFPRTVIHIGKSAEAHVVETFIAADDDKTYLTTPLTDIAIEENAILHHVKLQQESLKAYHIGNTRVWQDKNSDMQRFSFMSGAALTRNDLDIAIDGEGSNATLNGLYCIRSNQHVDNHSSVDHKFPNCTSNQLYKGLLNDSARSVFNGKIFVRSIAQQTNSYQLNKNLLLGKGCRVDTKPQLEIDADDVKCTHGATIGQLNEDEIFYLQSRCISRKDAIRILSQGFIEDTVSSIKNSSIKQKIDTLLKPILASL